MKDSDYQTYTNLVYLEVGKISIEEEAGFCKAHFDLSLGRKCHQSLDYERDLLAIQTFSNTDLQFQRRKDQFLFYFIFIFILFHFYFIYSYLFYFFGASLVFP